MNRSKTRNDLFTGVKSENAKIAQFQFRSQQKGHQRNAADSPESWGRFERSKFQLETLKFKPRALTVGFKIWTSIQGSCILQMLFLNLFAIFKVLKF